MSNTNSIFDRQPVRVPNRSGFNCDHEILTTCETGTITPLLVDELAPETTISLGDLCNVVLPPFATDYNGKLDFRIEAFWCPTRLVWQGWKSFISRQNQFDPDVAPPVVSPKITLAGQAVYAGPSLATSIGDKIKEGDPQATRTVSQLPYLCYHKIWEDWYRDARIQKAAFKPSASGAGSMPWSMATATYSEANQMADGVLLGSLRQRNYAKDYFTTAMLKQSLGDNLRVAVTMPSVNTTGTATLINYSNSDEITANTTGAHPGFSIAQLREINTLQHYMDTLGACGNKYEDVMRAIWGCSPADETVNKPLYLGSTSIGCYNKGVAPQYAAGDTTSSKNPLYTDGVIGAKASTADAVGNGSLVGNFTTKEHGFLFVLGTLVPHAYYDTVTDRKSAHFAPSDYLTGILAGAGNQQIWKWELTPDLDTNTQEVFGWTDRYAEYKFKHDRVLNGFQDFDGAYYKAFRLARSFDNSVTLSSSFLEIPKNALDDVLALKYSANPRAAETRVDIYFKYSLVQPCPSYSIPTLGLPVDTHTEMIPRAGKRL